MEKALIFFIVCSQQFALHTDFSPKRIKFQKGKGEKTSEMGNCRNAITFAFICIEGKSRFHAA